MNLRSPWLIAAGVLALALIALSIIAPSSALVAAVAV